MANKKAQDNAVQHGLTSSRVVLPQLGENVTDWEAFRDGWRDVLKPRNLPETELADRIAGLAWRLRRAEAYQLLALTRAAMNTHMDLDAILGPQLPPKAAGQYRQLGHVLGLLDGHNPAQAQRYEVTLERQLQRNLAIYAQLRELAA